MVNMMLLSFSSFNSLIGAWSIPVHGVLFRFIPITLYFQVNLRWLRHIPLISGTLVKQDTTTTTNPLSHGGTYCSEMLQNEWFLMIIGGFSNHCWRKFWVSLLWHTPEWRISMILGSPSCPRTTKPYRSAALTKEIKRTATRPLPHLS